MRECDLDYVYSVDFKSIMHKLYSFLLIIHNPSKLHSILKWNFRNYGIEGEASMNQGNEKSPLITIPMIFFSWLEGYCSI